MSPILESRIQCCCRRAGMGTSSIYGLNSLKIAHFTRTRCSHLQLRATNWFNNSNIVVWTTNIWLSLQMKRCCWNFRICYAPLSTNLKKYQKRFRMDLFILSVCVMREIYWYKSRMTKINQTKIVLFFLKERVKAKWYINNLINIIFLCHVLLSMQIFLWNFQYISIGTDGHIFSFHIYSFQNSEFFWYKKIK